MTELELHGLWYSPFVLRVVWTLKLKGIPYEYIEEDLFNKSLQLLQYNPVHKKVPVLVHDGKPICESMNIVAYIDEIWPHNPLLPADPYERAQARFWARYVDDDMLMAISALYRSSVGESREKAVEDIWERLKVVEDQCLSDQKKFFGGDAMNIVDIAFGSFAKFIEVLEDVLQLKVLEAERFPCLHLWFNNFKDVPVIQENIPDKEKYVTFMKPHREKTLAMASS